MRHRLLIAGALVGTLLVAGLTALALASPSEESPSPTAFSEGGENMSRWHEALTGAGHDVRALLSDVALADEAASGQSLLVLVEPEPLEEHQAAILDEHLADGGSIMVLDPAGNTNAWLAKYGAAVSQRNVLDPRLDDPTAVATNATLDGRDIGPVLDRAPATLLLDGEAWLPIRTSPATTHLDIDADGSIDRTDRPGPHLIEAQRPADEGTLVVAASSHHVADEAFEAEGTENRAYTQALAQAVLDAEASILVAEGHHGWTSSEAPWAAGIVGVDTLDRLPLWVKALASLLLAGLAVAVVRGASTMRPFQPHEPTTDPVEPRESLEDPSTAKHLAWRLVADQADESVASLQAQGIDALTSRMDLESPIERALAGQARPADAADIASRFQERDDV